jgi:histidyl-tRNA synthetase
MCDPIVDAVVISLSDTCASAALVFARALRRRGIRTECDVRPVKPKKKFELASKRGAYYVIVLGEDELTRHVVQVKDLDADNKDPNKQIELPTEAAICYLDYMLVPNSKVIIPQRIIQVK